jgi:carboxypeptidase C (cathepsin A)
MLAFIQEHGPWLIKDGSVPGAPMVKNELSWNLEANILYIEQPAGVGYSFCDFKNKPE